VLLEELVREVQRKIGRNLLHFQKLEYLLKYIVANGQYSGFISDLQKNISSKRELVNKLTMGQLIGELKEYHLTNAEGKRKGAFKLGFRKK